MRERWVPVTDVRSEANRDWLLGADLWLIKRGEAAGSAEGLREPLVFALQQMEATTPPLRHKLIRGRSGGQSRVVGAVRLLPVPRRQL